MFTKHLLYTWPCASIEYLVIKKFLKSSQYQPYFDGAYSLLGNTGFNKSLLKYIHVYKLR